MDQQKHTTEDTLTDIFGSKEMRSPAPTEFIPKNKTAPEIAYQLVKDETYPVVTRRQTRPKYPDRADNPYFSPLPLFGWETEFLSLPFNRIPHKTDHPLFMPETI